MPRAAPSACIEAGCAKLATKGSRCEDHTKERETTYRETPERKRLNRFYSSPQWRALSKAFRRRHPLCGHCIERGVTTPADMVDHILPVRTHWDRRLDASNMQALCNPCHAVKTAKDRRS